MTLGRAILAASVILAATMATGASLGPVRSPQSASYMASDDLERAWTRERAASVPAARQSGESVTSTGRASGLH